MVVNEEDTGLGPHPPEPGEALGVHHNGPAYGAAGEFLGVNEGEVTPVTGEEIGYVAVKPAGQHRYSRGIYLGRCQQRCQRVEVGVLVRKDHFHPFSSP